MERKIKLLYAEDSEEWAEMVKQILEAEYFEVEIARDGEEAWQKFQANPPDMVLLDIDMPKRNGWELVEEFKKEKEWISVVLYSSFYDLEKISEAFGLGAEDFLSKECTAKELAERLKAYYKRTLANQQKAELLKISEKIVFNATSNVLEIEGRKEILKKNESQLLYLLCLKLNQEADREYLCEGIWGKGMYNEAKCKALKIHITNLRKYLSGDPSISITNKRWGGYCLINSAKS